MYSLACDTRSQGSGGISRDCAMAPPVLVVFYRAFGMAVASTPTAYARAEERRRPARLTAAQGSGAGGVALAPRPLARTPRATFPGSAPAVHWPLLRLCRLPGSPHPTAHTARQRQQSCRR